MAFLPAGTAPYSAVYGPASALRAQRAVLLLALAISFLSTVFGVLAALGLFLSEFPGLLVSLRACVSAAPLSAGLRC